MKMKKLIQTILVSSVVFLFTITNVRAQDDVTYIEESPVDSSHMEQTINLGAEEADESDQSWILYAGIAVILVAGVVIVVKKKKK